MANVKDDDAETLDFADESEYLAEESFDDRIWTPWPPPEFFHNYSSRQVRERRAGAEQHERPSD